MRQKLCKVLVTGGAGFIGSEFVRQGVKNGQDFAVVDTLTYAGDLNRLKDVEKKIRFYKVSISNKDKLEEIFKKERPKTIIHFAAETHVDRSIHQSVAPFIETNILGTQNLIDLARTYSVERFLHISTDEVYGDSQKGKFKEDTSPLKPNNPYASTKAAAELLVRAAIRTHNFPGIIVRPSNNYGPWQYPEKFVPVILLKALRNQKIPVYGQGAQIREWLYVRDCAKAINTILKKGKVGEIYNIGSYFEQNNLTTVKKILKLLNKPESLIEFVKDRPGHDFRYSVDYGKLKALGWEPQVSFQDGMKETIQWAFGHSRWMEKKLTDLECYWKKIYQKKGKSK